MNINADYDALREAAEANGLTDLYDSGVNTNDR
jgi:hypothetical protein